MALFIYESLNSNIARAFWINYLLRDLRNKKNPDLYFSNQTQFDLKSKIGI